MNKISIFVLSLLACLTFCFSSVSEVSAMTLDGQEVSDLPEAAYFEDENYFFIYKYTYQGVAYYRCEIFDSPIKQVVAYNDYYVITLNDGNYNASDYFVSANGGYWNNYEYKLELSGTYTTRGGSSDNVVLYSPVNVVNASGDTVFQAPQSSLVEEILGMMETEAPLMKEEIQGMMTVVMVGSIGCLALLISLPLFGKVLYRFL